MFYFNVNMLSFCRINDLMIYLMAIAAKRQGHI